MYWWFRYVIENQNEHCLLNLTVQTETVRPPHLTNSRFPNKQLCLTCNHFAVQVRSMRENDVQEVARHIGHERAVHRKFYRLHDDVIELA